MFHSKSFPGKTRNGVDIERTFLMPERKSYHACFVVANRSIAHLLERTDRNSAPTLIKTLKNPAGREKLSDVLNENSGLHDEITQGFCRSILREISETARGINQLVLVASPQILGALRQRIVRKPFPGTEVLNFSKDLSKISLNHLPQRLKTLLSI